jgi:ATP-binding cassette, subfamily B, bacterial
MAKEKEQNKPNQPKKPGIFSLLKPYMGLVIFLVIFAMLSNSINLLLPKIIANGIDAFTHKQFAYKPLITEFTICVAAIFIFTYLQSVIQTYASEKVARDLRSCLSDKISRQSYAFVETVNPNKLLTNLTADVDSIKMFVSQAIVSIVSSLFTIIGASILLLTINWRLALCVIAIIPVIGGTFFYVLKKVRVLFKESRAVIDWLNKVINESILGSALIRVINSQQLEYDKFLMANTRAKDFGLKILSLFAGLIPIITFTANMAGLSILALGGHYVITGSMSLGNFAAFNSYLALLIFPILVIGFMSNIIAQATASYERIGAVIDSVDSQGTGTIKETLRGDIELKNVSVMYGQKPALKDV